MKKFMSFLLIAFSLVCLVACRSSDHTSPNATQPAPTTAAPTVTVPTTAPVELIPQRPDTIYTRMETYRTKTFVYTSEELGFPILIYIRENYTYSIQGSPLSSSIYAGYWQIDGDVLILGTADSGYHFQITEAGLVFLAEPSTKPANSIPMEDGNLFTERPYTTSTYRVTVYSLPGDTPANPLQLCLFEGGYYCFLGAARNEENVSGTWSIEDGVLHLDASLVFDDPYNWYFRVEADGLVYLASQSSEFPLQASIAEGDKLPQQGQALTPGNKTLYLCYPAAGGSCYNLSLRDCGYFEITGPQISSLGYWTMDGDKLNLHRSVNGVEQKHCFLITETGFVYLEENSDPLYNLVAGDCFTVATSSSGATRGFLYTFRTDSQADPYQLFVSCTDTFQLVIPGANQTLNGNWVLKGDIPTLTVYYYTEDYQILNRILTFQISDESAIFLSEQSEALPDGILLPEGLILQLSKAELP